MTAYSVTIPNWHPTTLNALLGKHWGKRGKMKRGDFDIIHYYFLNCPRATQKRRITLKIGLGKKQRGGDPDAYFKSLNDGLVKDGLLKNDSKEWVELAPVEYYRTKDGKPETIIILEDI